MLYGKRLPRCLLAAFLPLLASWNLPAQSTRLPVNGDVPAGSRQDNPQERARWFLRGRTVNGRPGALQLRDAYERKLKQRRRAALPAGWLASQAEDAASPLFSPYGGPIYAPASAPPSNGLAWVQIGTGGTATASGTSNQDYGIAAGRATAVVVDQGDPTGNTVYVGGATGGLWRTTNATASASLSCLSGGVCWTPLIDSEATLAVGAIAVQPGNSNLVLVGTGEANNSADSYYGLGLLRSTNALAASPSWTLIEQATVNGVAQPLHGLGFTRIAFSTDNSSLVVAAAAASSEALQVGAETGGSSLRGLYYSTDSGASWTYAAVSDSSVPVAAGSVTAVIYNPVRHRFYAAYRYHGIYSSADGAAWTRLSSQPGGSTLNLNGLCPASPFSTACPLYRAELAIVPNTDGTWRDEMYIWIVDSNSNNRGLYLTTDGGLTWAAVSTAGIDNCGDAEGCGTQQGTYNLTLAAVPDGQATDLYAGAVNQYKCRLLPDLTGKPIPATCSFVNLTHAYGCSNPIAPAHVHPDFHGIDFPHTNPLRIFFANDGGVYRTLNSLATYDGSCSNLPNPPWFDNLNANLGSMLQFVSFSQDPADSSTILGGTQDNGSPAISAASPSQGSWIAVNNGDGGFNEINPAAPSEWFTTNTYLPILRCTAGIHCTASGSNPFVPAVTQTMAGGDHSSFYTPYKLDPQAAARILVGTCRVWRGNSDGTGSEWATTGTLGNPLSNPFDNTAGACAASSLMVSALDAGGPCNGPACAVPTPTGGGSQVIWAGTEGTPADPANGITGSGGELWVTTNADGGPSTWQRVDGGNLGLGACAATPSACNINPKFYNISDIALDRSDAAGRTAYVTIMGFGAAHLLKTADAGATWAKLDGDPQNGGLPDAPANAVTLDPTTAGLVYVGTDVGVFTTSDNGASWTELGAASGLGALPNVPVTRLRVFNSSGSLRLRASTYGRGVWDTPLAGNTAADFSIAVTPQSQAVFAQNALPGAAAIFSGTLSLFNNYNSQITLVCVSGSTSPPQTCAANPGIIPAPRDGQAFTVTAANATVGDFNFKIQAGGSDPQNLFRSQTVVLRVADFTLGASPTTLTVPQDSVGSVQLTITPHPVALLTGTISLACGSLPPGVICSFTSGSQVSAATISSVPLQIAVAGSAAVGVYQIAVSASYTMPGTSDTLIQTQVLTLTVTVPPLFAISGYLTPAEQIATRSFTGQIQVVPQGGFSGTINLSCDSDGLGSCTLSPSAVVLSTSTVTADITVATTSAMSGTHHPAVTGSGGGTSHAVPFEVTVENFSLIASPALVVAPPGSSASATVQLQPLSGYGGKVSLKCTPSAQVAFVCNLDPGPFALAAGVQTTASVWVPSGTGIAGNYPIALTAVDADSLTQTASFVVNVQDYKLDVSPGSAAVAAGKSSTHTLTITGLGGFAGPVTFNAGSCIGLPALATCSFSPATVNATAAGTTATLTITTTSPALTQAASAGRSRGEPFYALWLPLAGVVLGLARVRRCRLHFRHWIRLCVVLAALVLQISCGTGAGSGLTAPPPTPTPGTPGGTYSITVTGNATVGSATLQRSASVTLTVQ